jgi:hypothetical protein
VYNAGNAAVPTGDFALQIDVAAAGVIHGSLRLTMYVLAFPGTDCGAEDTEAVNIQF